MARATRAEWEQRFLAGLQEEWEIARWQLPREHASALRIPTFSLTDAETTWGCWHGAPLRDLRLSRKLVWNHPWYAVVDVLRHEMAHQVAYEILGGQNEPPHGPSFRQACKWLRIAPRATDSYPTLDQLVAGQEEIGENDRIHLRVQKLLALAESPNRHEAERALAKAQELMARHNVDLIDRGTKRDYLSIRLGEAKKRHSRDVYILAGILGEFYLVRPIWITGYDPQRGTAGKVLEISGTAMNVRLAHYVYDFVRQYCDREWRVFSFGRRLGSGGRRDFTIGILSGFADKLRQETSHASPQIRDLVQRGDPGLDHYLGERYPRLRTRRGNRLSCRTDLLEAGERLGRDLTVRPGVESGQGPRLLGS
ncbi:MAG: DUF2786 domain-containing protein [Victivallales bacterium]|nr:DUF2786 domain-containing protein [Victivallales bacterium]